MALVKEMESQGYQYEGAEASFEILMKKAMGKVKEYFQLKGFRVIVDISDEDLADPFLQSRRQAEEALHQLAQNA